MIYKITTTRTFETQDHDTAQAYLNKVADRNRYLGGLEIDDLTSQAGERIVAETGIIDAGTDWPHRTTVTVKVEALGGKL
jgi:hypothetical protein